jgi:hypothetical protein
MLKYAVASNIFIVTIYIFISWLGFSYMSDYSSIQFMQYIIKEIVSSKIDGKIGQFSWKTFSESIDMWSFSKNSVPVNYFP